jgi:hypothetical protein
LASELLANRAFTIKLGLIMAAGLCREHEEAAECQQAEATGRQAQRQPRQRPQGQLGCQAPDAQFQQHEVAHQQRDADDVQHLQRRVGPGVRGQTGQAGEAGVERGFWHAVTLAEHSRRRAGPILE